jgi:hypothetical protein
MYLRFLLAILIVLAGCKGVEQVVNNSPAAVTPQGPTLYAVLSPGGGWVSVGPAGNGSYEILPSGLSSGGFLVGFRAPYPADLRLLLDGVELFKFDRLPTGTNPLTTGYYRIADINANQDPAQWRISVRPPGNGLSVGQHVLEVRMVSINPNFPVENSSHESPSLVFTLNAQRNYTFSVLTVGNGRGLVRSLPVNGSSAMVDCGTSCMTDFGQSVTVELRATPLGGAQFAGWSGACTGTGACSVTLNGSAEAVTASFTDSSIAVSTTCPAPIEISGFSLANQPRCASNDIAGHPSAALGCDGQGFYCCESVVGANSARCGSGKTEFVPDCLYLGNLAQLFQPYGCYVRDRVP